MLSRIGPPAPLSFFVLQQQANCEDYMDQTRYTFLCSLQDLRSKLVEPVLAAASFLSTAAAQGFEKRLGSFEEALWLADIAWNVANLLIHTQMCHFQAEAEAEGGGGAHPEPSSGRLLVASQLFELAKQFYGVCTMHDRGREYAQMLQKNMHTCSLVAASCKLDAHAIPSANSPSPEGWDDGILREASLLAEQALTSLNEPQHLGFHDGESLTLQKTALMVMFTALCRGGGADTDTGMGSTSACSGGGESAASIFLQKYRSIMHLLSAEELERCATVATAGPAGAASIAYELLNMAWERCQNSLLENAAADWGQALDLSSAGDIKGKLLSLAPSREAATRHLEDLLGICKGSSSRSSSAESSGNVGAGPRSIIPVRPETVDRAVAVAFNYGCSLNQLGLVDQAESFVAQALALLQSASQAFVQQWRGAMEQNYFRILTAKSQAKGQGHIDRLAPGKGAELRAFGQKVCTSTAA